MNSYKYTHRQLTALFKEAITGDYYDASENLLRNLQTKSVGIFKLLVGLDIFLGLVEIFLIIMCSAHAADGAYKLPAFLFGLVLIAGNIMVGSEVQSKRRYHTSFHEMLKTENGKLLIRELKAYLKAAHEKEPSKREERRARERFFDLFVDAYTELGNYKDPQSTLDELVVIRKETDAVGDQALEARKGALKEIANNNPVNEETTHHQTT